MLTRLGLNWSFRRLSSLCRSPGGAAISCQANSTQSSRHSLPAFLDSSSSVRHVQRFEKNSILFRRCTSEAKIVEEEPSSNESVVDNEKSVAGKEESIVGSEKSVISNEDLDTVARKEDLAVSKPPQRTNEERERQDHGEKSTKANSKLQDSFVKHVKGDSFQSTEKLLDENFGFYLFRRVERCSIKFDHPEMDNEKIELMLRKKWRRIPEEEKWYYKQFMDDVLAEAKVVSTLSEKEVFDYCFHRRLRAARPGWKLFVMDCLRRPEKKADCSRPIFQIDSGYIPPHKKDRFTEKAQLLKIQLYCQLPAKVRKVFPAPPYFQSSQTPDM